MRRISLIAVFFAALACGLGATPPTPDEIKTFYTLHEGSDMLPVWLLKELKATGGGPFLGPDNLSHYGLLLDASLPLGAIGLSVNKERGMAGINCAACHVNQFTYQGKKTEVLNGSPSLFDATQFTIDMYAAVEKQLLAILLRKVKVKDIPKLISQFSGFPWTEIAGDVSTTSIQPGPQGVSTTAATMNWDIGGQKDMGKYLVYLAERLKYLLKIQRVKEKNSRVIFGPGRVDDFGGARDVIWPLDSAVELSGPSSFIDLWNFQRKTWVHWDLNMNSKFDRNLGQAITGGALYRNLVTADAANIGALEDIAEKFSAPEWPSELWTPILPSATHGGDLFREKCAYCHNDMQKLVPVGDVGTDPSRATIYTKPMPDGRDFIQVAQVELLGIKELVFASPMNQGASANRSQIDPIGSDAKWQKTNAYVARSLRGIWASPPYLHNGSVPTLREVLNCRSRPPGFKIDPKNPEYNVKDGGLVYVKCTGGETGCFDTKVEGNFNTGHPYGDELSEDDRTAVIEYLKTIH